MQSIEKKIKGINTLEDVYESIGGFSRFQILATCAIMLPEIPAGIMTMLPVVVGAYPRAWICTEIDDSELYINSTSPLDASICSCNATLYGGISSIVSEWALVCDYAWVTDCITSVQMTGMLFGSILGSQIPDWIGRKKSMYLSCFLALIIGVASGFAPSAFLYAGTRFLTGLFIGFYINMNTVYLNEFLLPNRRNSMCLASLSPWSIGLTLLAPMAYLIESWRMLSWVSASLFCVVFAYFAFLPESPRWLLQSGKIEEAKKSLDSICSWNRYPPVDLQVVESLAYREIVQGCRKSEGEINRHVRISWLQLLRNPEHRSKIMILAFTWFSLALVYYGLAFQTKNLDGNLYINLACLGLIEMLSVLITAFMVERFGKSKHKIISVCLAWTSVFLTFVSILPYVGIQYSFLWVTYLTLAARFGVSAGWHIIKDYTEEAFSAENLSIVLEICSTAESIGGIIAPQFVFLGTIYRSVPYYAFGLLSLTCLVTWSFRRSKYKNAENIP